MSPVILGVLQECAATAEPGQELDFTSALQKLVDREPVFAYRFEGRRFDCSSKLGFLEATVNFALGHPEVGEAFAGVLGRLRDTGVRRTDHAASRVGNTSRGTSALPN